MANDYLKHYGVKKSQWSPQARARYDARHRPKAISDASNTSGSFGPAQSEAYKQLTPKERDRVDALAKQSKKFRKQYTSGFNIMGQGIPKFIAKRIDKKSNFGALQNKYAEEVIRNRKFKTGTPGQSVGAAHIIKRQTRNDRKNYGRSTTQDTTYGDSVRDAGSGTNKRVGTSVVGKKKSTTASGRMNASGYTIRDNKRVTLASGNGKRLGQRIQNGKSAIGETLAERSKFTNASLPKAGFIFKRPQARTVGKELYKATKKEAHKVKKQNDAAKKEAQDAFERHKKEAEASYAKQQKEKEKKKKQAAKEDKKAVDAYNRNLERNKREYMKGTSTETDFWGNTRKVKNSEIFKSKNPFDRLATSYIPMKTSDNKVVRGLKKAYNSLGYNYNITKKEQKASEKRYKEREKEKKKKQKEYDRQMKEWQKKSKASSKK